jgi:2-polyprenyl-6-methoxyphenol hydroxylase-like FAD-dependent oxidoreductase
MGITDAAALSELIIGARSSGNDFATRQLLRKYERWRKTENNKMTMILEGLKNIFEHKGELIAFARGNGMSLVNRAPFIKNIIMKYAMGLSGDVPSIVTSAQIEEFSNAG